jgi:hypothetical protein
MTDLSPAQKALAAFNERYELCGPFDDDWAEQCLAVALEAVADQVVPKEPMYSFDLRWMYERDTRQTIRSRILAIANELRGDTTATTQENN